MSSHCHLETVPGHLVLAREEACVVYEHIHPRRLELIDQATDRIEGGNIDDVEVVWSKNSKLLNCRGTIRTCGFSGELACLYNPRPVARAFWGGE